MILPPISIPWWDKHSSLFFWSVGEERKSRLTLELVESNGDVIDELAMNMSADIIDGVLADPAQPPTEDQNVQVSMLQNFFYFITGQQGLIS